MYQVSYVSALIVQRGKVLALSYSFSFSFSFFWSFSASFVFVGLNYYSSPHKAKRFLIAVKYRVAAIGQGGTP